MSESPQKDQDMKKTSTKKWCDVSCKACNKLLSFNHFTCQNCKSNFCLECYKGVISFLKTCISCNLNSTQIFEIQESIQEYQSALITCEFSYNGCETILPYKEIYIHQLKCPFSLPKCINKNLIAEFQSKNLNICVPKKRTSPENQPTICMNEIEDHSKFNSSWIFCKMMILIIFEKSISNSAK